MGLTTPFGSTIKTKIIHKHENVNLKKYDVTPKMLQGINPMILCDPWADYKTNNSSPTLKFNKQPYDVTQEKYK